MRNEAAERLSDSFGAYPRWPIERQDATLTEALAAEHRATVERIRERILARATVPAGITGNPYLEGIAAYRKVMLSILDEEAAR